MFVEKLEAAETPLEREQLIRNTLKVSYPAVP